MLSFLRSALTPDLLSRNILNPPQIRVGGGNRAIRHKWLLETNWVVTPFAHLLGGFQIDVLRAGHSEYECQIISFPGRGNQ